MMSEEKLVVGLRSDYRDYYDHWFAGSWQRADIIFNRYTVGGLPRPAMFKRMAAWGLKVPRHGTGKELSASLSEVNTRLVDAVVYTDVMAHTGDGKIKINLRDAGRYYPNHFCSEYISTIRDGGGKSLRYLRIGSRQFWLRYSSADDWRSNCGDVSISILFEFEGPKELTDLLYDKIKYPLFAVDFVEKGGVLFAIDFNISPGIKGTGIEKHMLPEEVYSEIFNSLKKKWIKL